MSAISWFFEIWPFAALLFFVSIVAVQTYYESRRRRIDRRVEQMLEEELGQTFDEAEAYFTLLDDLQRVEEDAPTHQDEALS